MLDHVFTDAIGALRDAFEAALLERLGPDERFQLDVVSGDTVWEASYGLPGEGTPPRVRADLSLDWPTEAQTAFRAWLRNEEPPEPPVIHLSVVLRVQRLTHTPDPATVLAVLPAMSAAMGTTRLERRSPTVETAYDADLLPAAHAIECAFEGAYDLGDDVLTNGALLDGHFQSMGGWIASILVRLGDLPLSFQPSTS